MKDITVYIKLPAYLRQWSIHTMGNPIRFPEQSYENHLLHRYLWRSVRGAQPPSMRCPGDCVAVVITDDRCRKPEFYNILSRRGQTAMLRAIESLFRIHLWSECVHLIHGHGEMNQGIDRWCAAHGIGLEYREAVRQKFYRMRRSYETMGIILGKKHRKKFDTTGQK